MALENLLVADLGNRFLKLARVVNRVIEDRRVCRVDFPLPAHAEAFAGAVSRVAYASVNPAREPDFEAWVRGACGRAPEQLGRDLEIPLRNACRGVGTDRLANALAAVRRFPGGALVVDIGTAITVDLVSDEAQFLGGAILPGPHLGARALGEYAAQLPVVEPAPPVRAVGRATKEAIRSGLHHGTVGAIRELIGCFVETVRFRPALVVTGGDAAPYLASFPGAVHVSNLTLEGVVACVEGSA